VFYVTSCIPLSQAY